MSDEPDVWEKLHHLVVKSEKPNISATPAKQQSTAAAGSTSHIPHVEMELKQEPPQLSSACDISTHSSIAQSPKHIST